MGKCIYCGKDGEKHHIIYRRNGGLDIPINYVYLCTEHHRGKIGPHKNKKQDILLKLKLQSELINLLEKDKYTKEEIKELFSLNENQVKKMLNNIGGCDLKYARFDIIKYLMGGRFYMEYMLDEEYDDSWNVYEEDYYRLVL